MNLNLKLYLSFQIHSQVFILVNTDYSRKKKFLRIRISISTEELANGNTASSQTFSFFCSSPLCTIIEIDKWK